MRRQNVVRLILGILLAAGGCSICRPTTEGKRMGIPSCAKAVGGGVKISYEVPEDGVCYLVDQTRNRLLGTETIERDSVFEFDISDAEPKTMKRLGIDSDSKIILYFAPQSCLNIRNEQP